tara:strand:+ start:69 stop:227 length:159 start_codon:yes stop_codon:yes gene_type:complete
MDQAFPFGAEYGCAVYATQRSRIELAVSAVSWAAMCCGLLALMLAYFDVLVK